MMRVLFSSALLLASASALGGCATSLPGLGGTDSPAAQPVQQTDPQMADALPPMMPVEEFGSASVRPPITGTCGMEELQHLVGRPRTTVSVRELPTNFRVLGSDTIATMDYRADRLTIRIDRHDRIESLSCG